MNNLFKYWGRWGLPIRGVFGRASLVTGVLLGAVKATVRALRWHATLAVQRWHGEVKRLGR